MDIYIFLGVVGGLALIVLLVAYICFYRVFFSPKRKPLGPDEYDLPPGDIYEAHHDEMIAWIKDIRTMPHEDVSITSFDGLTLRGKFYEYKEGAPIELLFHGYQGNAERDLSGGVERCFAIGRSALIINQRASDDSDGSVISFGINERRDCISWINYAVDRFGTEVKIILTGISMGAATVMMAAGEDLPKNVVCVLADCGYTSARDIIKKIIKEMHLPAGLLYPFVKLGALIYGRFNLEETAPIEAVKKSRTPIIFIHGDTDDFVPYYMSEELYEACAAKKKLVPIKNAGHGLAYPTDKEAYLNALKDFELECGWNSAVNAE